MSSVYTCFYLGEFTDVHQGLYFCIIQDDKAYSLGNVKNCVSAYL